MEQIKNNSILDIPNQKLGNYDFIAASGDRNEGQYFCNDFVGLPSIPIIGKYGKNGYEMNAVPLLIAHECFCDPISNKIVTSSSQEEINLPQKVKNIIFRIPEVIKNNKPITDDNEESEKKHDDKKKKSNNIPEFHPFEFPPALQINFMWSVSFQNKRIFTKARPNFMNIVFHPYIYQTIIFEKTKRMFTNIPVCMIPAGVEEKEEENCGVRYWDKDQRSISFNSIRSEYLSVHMKGPSLCFSPNNMKFEMNPEQDIVHFFSFVLTEDGFYHIVYHWNINNFDLHKPLSQIFQTQKTTRDIINNLPVVINQNHPALKQLKSLFIAPDSQNKSTQQNQEQQKNSISESQQK
ncbi:hypothetical protein ABPG72_006870 [Tetrahymena utriculariae]